MGRYARNSIGQYAPVGAAADDLPGGATPTGKKTIDTTAEVDVASYATAQVVDENLTAANIKKDVEVLGITGEFEGGGGGMADSIYPFSATITFIVSGVTAGETADFCQSSFYSPIFSHSEYGYDAVPTVSLPNGEGQEYYILSLFETAEIDFDENPPWSITCDDNSSFHNEDDAYWIEITGDTTIQLVLL